MYYNLFFLDLIVFRMTFIAEELDHNMVPNIATFKILFIMLFIYFMP